MTYAVSPQPCGERRTLPGGGNAAEPAQAQPFGWHRAGAAGRTHPAANSTDGVGCGVRDPFDRPMLPTGPIPIGVSRIAGSARPAEPRAGRRLAV